MMCDERICTSEGIRVLRHLGQGSFAECKSVKLVDQGNPTPVLCCKQLRSFRRGNDAEVDQFRKEMAILKSLNHRNIVKYVGRSDSLSPCFMLLEYVEGGSLRKLLLKQMVSPGKKLYSDGAALRWCQQLASVLAYLHSRDRPLIHRDLHPDNVMLTHSDPELADIRLIDFGLHRELDDADSNLEAEGAPGRGLRGTTKSLDLSRNSNALQKAAAAAASCLEEGGSGGRGLRRSISVPMTGQTGAFMYMSPEMVHSKKYDTATDVFSLGVNMFEIFSRVLRSVVVCANQNSAEVLETYAYKVAAGFRPAMPESMPHKVAQLISECWAQDPASRPTAAEVLASLDAILAARPGQPPAAPKKETAAPRAPLLRAFSRKLSLKGKGSLFQ